MLLLTLQTEATVTPIGELHVAPTDQGYISHGIKLHVQLTAPCTGISTPSSGISLSVFAVNRNMSMVRPISREEAVNG